MRNPKTKLQRLLLNLMLILSISCLSVTLIACRTKVVAIPSDKSVVAMPAGVAYTPAVKGWFVPDARMVEILNALEKERLKP
jgi:hypothetical protein